MTVELPIVLVAKPKTLQIKMGFNKGKENPITSDVCHVYFEDNLGRKVLVVHGSEYGLWPRESSEALRLFPEAQVIYCCYPRTMRLNTRDKRIIGNHDKPTLVETTEIIKDGGFVITIMEAR